MFVDYVGFGPAVVPGVTGRAERGKDFEGDEAGEAAQDGGFGGDTGAVLVDGAGEVKDDIVLVLAGSIVHRSAKN